MEWRLTKNQLNQFQLLLDVYRHRTIIPKRGNWKLLAPGELWLWMVNQVLVVGSSSSAARFAHRKDLQAYIGWEELGGLQRADAIQKRIHCTLRQLGTRFAAKELGACRKTQSLFYNFRVLKAEREGFKTILRRLQRMGGEEAELKRVAYMMNTFQFLNSKSARDLLMNLGMNRTTLALDIRTQNIFRHFRLPFPSTAELGQPAFYDAAERHLIAQICVPLDVEPIVLDRLFYQHYLSILRRDYLQLKFSFYYT